MVYKFFIQAEINKAAEEAAAREKALKEAEVFVLLKLILAFKI